MCTVTWQAHFRFTFFLLTGLSLVSGLAYAQQPRNRQVLEKEKKQNLEKITEIRSILKQTSTEKQATMGKLKALNQQIKSQSEQINLMTEDLKLMDSEVVDLRNASNKLNEELGQLKKQYAEMVYSADKRRQQLNPLGFLFSSDNFNQLVARYRYLKQYSDARHSQVKQMERVKGMLQEKRIATEQKRSQQKTTLTAKVSEGKKLEGLKDEQNKVVKELSQREVQLRDELVESRRAVTNLENMITRIIAREAKERAEREAREKAEREARERAERERLARLEAERKAEERRRAEDQRKADEQRRAEALANANKPADNPAEPKPAEPKSAEPKPAEPKPEPKAEAPVVVSRPAEARENNLNEAEYALASSFAASKNRLPWPVQHGFVSDKFGVKPHPVLKGLMVENMGIDIQTNAGESVQSVYDGVVQDVAYMPGMNNVVAIQHGNYMTVYAKLKSVSVKIGQRVKARDMIGSVATGKDGITEIQFQIWKNLTKMNPEAWLRPR